MKKAYLVFMLVVSFSLIFGSYAYAEYADGESVSDAENKAVAIHKKVMSDVIYTEQEIKALYYQNIVIIDLLQDIKDLLSENLESMGKKEE